MKRPALDAQGNPVLDAEGFPVIETLRGERAKEAVRAIDQHFAKLRDKVENWNKKVDGTARAKEISGRDVMEVLEIASMLTNNRAYEAARRAMRLHRLDAGGLRRGFLALHERHITPPEVACVLSVEPEPDNVTWYIAELQRAPGCRARRGAPRHPGSVLPERR